MDLERVKELAEPRRFSPDDELPYEYRKEATRMIQFHANSEIMGGFMEKPFIRKSPSLDRKLAFSAKVQDELGHAQLLYRAAESLGLKTRKEMLEELKNGEGKFMNCAHYRMDRWAETSMTSMLVDGAAMLRQATLKKTSYEPYAHAMDKICFEEGFHIKHGEDILKELVTGSKKEQRLAQDALDKWWPRTLQFFGPMDNESRHHDFMSEVGLKIKSNDELRQQYLNHYIHKLEGYGLEIPDEPRIEYDEDTGRYEVVEEDLDWDEFWTIVKNEDEEGLGMINERAAKKQAVEWVEDVFDSWERKLYPGSQATAAD